MARLIEQPAQGLSANLSTNEVKAAQHLIGHFNIDATADNEALGKVVYVDGNTKGHAVAGASKVDWTRSSSLTSMRIDRQGYHHQANPGNTNQTYRMCRYALQWGNDTYATISAQINIEFGTKVLRNALIQSLASNGVSQVVVMK